MIVSEIIDRIQSAYSSGVKSDDSRLSSRRIYNKMLTVRSMLLSRILKKKQLVNQFSYQTLECIELVSATPYECNELELYEGCKILRTKDKIPTPLNDYDNHSIQYVTSIDGEMVYSEITTLKAGYKKGAKYTRKKLDYFFKNGYVYVTHKSGPRLITISGLFVDPFEVAIFPNFCNDKSCDGCLTPMEIEFPFPEQEMDTLVEMCVQELVELMLKVPEDRSNNMSDNISEQSK